MVRSLGADTVIDYLKEDFTRGSQQYDLLIDVAGSHPLSACRRVIKPGGTFVGVGMAAIQNKSAGSFRVLGRLLSTGISSRMGKQKVVVLFIAALNKEDMAFLGELVESGKVVPYIERRYDLAGAPEALAYINEGHARAKVAIRIAGDD